MNEIKDDFNLDICVRTLEELKTTIEEASDRKELVSTNCEHFIPFLKRHPLFSSIISLWENEKKRLNEKLIECEANALKEVKQVFKEIKGKIPSENLSSSLKTKIQKINDIIEGKVKYSQPPIYRVIYNELRELLIALVDNGYEKICKKYAILGSKEEYKIESKNPQLITKTYIEKLTFAPSVWEAADVSDEMHWDKIHDPTIAWWYLEGAYRLWNTSEKAFDRASQKEPISYFELACHKNPWLEINAAKKGCDHLTIIFTDNLFKKVLIQKDM